MPPTSFEFPETPSGFKLSVPTAGGSFAVAYDASAASTNALSAYTSADVAVVRVTPTTDCFVTSAASPTAVANGTHHFLPAGVPQDLRFPSAHKLAFIKLAVAGSAYVTVLK